LVALDAEAKSKPAVDAWKRTYRHARFWPTPKAKDAGDFFKRGGDLKAWIESGLPSKSSVSAAGSPAPSPQHAVSSPAPLPPSSQDGAFSPVRQQNGGKGEKENTTEDTHKCIEITLSNGKVIYLVERKNETWDRMSAEGKPVFTRYELEKLKAATAALDGEQRIKAAMAAIEAKEVFGGYITKGGIYE
jgi:hypothetical protein